LNQGPLELGARVAGLLERLGIPYLIGGSVASSLHGEPRATLDVDIVVHLDRDRVEVLVQALESEFYVDPHSVREAADLGRHFNAIHRQSYLKVDLYARPRSGFFAEEIRRARPLPLGDPPAGFARVATPEDTILQKLRWYRDGNEVSDRQWRDVLGVVKVVGASLDRDHLDRWARELGVEDLLARALDQGGMRPAP